jgi:hypothetical protein
MNGLPPGETMLRSHSLTIPLAYLAFSFVVGNATPIEETIA